MQIGSLGGSYKQGGSMKRGAWQHSGTTRQKQSQ